MTDTLLLQKMANLLVLKGESVQEARDLVNQSTFARTQQVTISKEKLENIHSIDGLTKVLPGLKNIAAGFSNQIKSNANFSQAAMELKQVQALLKTGWNIFKGIKWMSGVYLTLLTVFIFIFHLYVIPAFTQVFSNFGVELPLLTRVLFTGGNLMLILFITSWVLVIGYLAIIKRINKCLKQFTVLPSWLFYVPVLGSICHLINQCMLLSIYKFLASSDSFILPERNAWHQRFNLATKDKYYLWADDYYQYLKLAVELNVLNEYLQDELDFACDRYIDKTSQSMKILTTFGATILALFIGSVVIAMYLPIFQIGLLL